MKFPRNTKIFRGQLDAAPFATVFFLLVMFMMLSTLVYTPGIPMDLQLPTAVDVPGSDKATVSVAVDATGRVYYQNQLIERRDLRDRLHEAVSRAAPEPLAMVLQADKNVTHETLVRLTMIARDAGITEARLATLPRPLSLPTGTR
jgi:biopolymer transport protein ExbD